MDNLLTQEQVNKYLLLLNQPQRDFIEENIKQKKKSKWLEILAHSKGINIDEKMSLDEIERKVADWILVDILDGGYKQRPYRCDCGTRLRYQYILKNSRTDETCKLGVNCLEKHINLPIEVIKDVKKGLYHIDLERDEILVKYSNREFYTKVLPDDVNLPSIIDEQLRLKLPLTELQIKQINRLLEKYNEKKRYYKLLEKLSKEQRDFIFLLSERDQAEVLENIDMKRQPNNSDLAGIAITDDIHQFVKLRLPLLERQQKLIEKQRKELIYNELNDNQKKFLTRFSNGEKEEILNKIKAGFSTGNLDMTFIDKKSEIFEQVQLQLPLLRRQMDELQRMRQEFKANLINRKHEVTYQFIIDRHLGTLQEVSKKEANIPQGLRKDWHEIKESVRQLKQGNNQSFNYRTFKVLLSNLIIPLKIEKDIFL